MSAPRRLFLTGVHTGLGHALLQEFLKQGHHVDCVSREPPGELIRHERVNFAPLDLSRLDQIEDGLRMLLADRSHFDLVILNAGRLGEIKDLGDTGLDELRSLMDLNVWANKVIYDALRKIGVAIDHVVAISSGSAFNGSGGWGGYSISKSALNLLFRTYAHEHPATHFTCLAPGLVHTPLIDSLAALPADERYPAVGRIRSALGTDKMQTSEQAAARIRECLTKLRERPTGGYVDIRDL